MPTKTVPFAPSVSERAPGTAAVKVVTRKPGGTVIRSRVAPVAAARASEPAGLGRQPVASRTAADNTPAAAANFRSVPPRLISGESSTRPAAS